MTQGRGCEGSAAGGHRQNGEFVDRGTASECVVAMAEQLRQLDEDNYAVEWRGQPVARRRGHGGARASHGAGHSERGLTAAANGHDGRRRQMKAVTAKTAPSAPTADSG